jgi:hypothetical protein
MIINNNTIKTEAEAYKARVIGDAIVNAFGAHRISFSDFSNDYSGVYGSAGSVIRVPLIGKTGGVKTANADGTDDFSINTKTTEHVDLELSLKYVTAPLTIGELETGAQLSDWATSLANDVVEDVQKTLEQKLLDGVTAGKVKSYIVGDADTFTATALTKNIRPMVKDGGSADPVCYLEGGHYASVIPMDKDGFDPATPHFGFTKICEYTSFDAGVCGFAASPSAVAVATRIPQSIMSNPAYLTKYAYQLPELGINVLYAEWANPNNGTMTAGLFYLCGMEVAKKNAAVVLKNS